MEKLTERLIEIDDTVPELPVKDVVSFMRSCLHDDEESSQEKIFRIYRDVRFSPDPTPYSTCAINSSKSQPGRQARPSLPVVHARYTANAL